MAALLATIHHINPHILHTFRAAALDVLLHGRILEAASNQTLDIKEGPGEAGLALLFWMPKNLSILRY